jgi:hypothetical protein
MSLDNLPLSQGRRRYARVKDATDIVSRSKLYEMAAKYPGLFKKLDGLVIVDLDRRDEIIASLPNAEISPRKRVETAG